jgi:hypothetical protein
LATILKKSKWLADVWETDLASRPVAGELFEKAVEIAHRILSGNINDATLRESLRCLAGRIPTRNDLDLVASRLVGNLDRLKMRRPVMPWGTQPLDEHALVRLISYRPEIRKVPTTRFQVMILSGLAAGLKTQIWWNRERCAVIAAVSGFDRPPTVVGATPKHHLYSVPAQLVGLFGEALIDGKESSAVGVPTFRQFRCPPALRQVNRELLKKRFRSTLKHTCPRKYPLNFPCHYCPAGYLECPAAVHEQTYVVQPCTVCKDEEAAFDPEWTLDKCVNCVLKEVSRK